MANLLNFRKSIIGLCMVIFCFHCGFTQALLIKDAPNYRTPEQVIYFIHATRKLFAEAGISSDNKATILKLDNDYFLIPDGYNYVFKWDNNTWANLYQGKFHGSNFNSFKFIYQGIIYSYGGFGFLRFHPEITFFDQGKGEWEIIRWNGEKPIIEGKSQDITFISGNFLYAYFNFQIALGNQPEYQPLNELYRFSLEDHIWSKLGKLKSDFQTTTRYVVQSDDYLAFISDEGSTAIIDKQDLHYKSDILLPSVFPKRNAIPSLQPPITQQVRANSIYFYQDTTFYSKLDLDSVYHAQLTSSHTLIQSPFFITTKFLVAGIVLLGGLMGWWLLNRQSTKPPQQEPSELERTFPLLFQHEGQTIDLDTLDQCLHLDESISTNSRRNKRSQIIRDLNNHSDFPIQINRVRNPLDKRIYGYLIERKHKS